MNMRLLPLLASPGHAFTRSAAAPREKGRRAAHDAFRRQGNGDGPLVRPLRRAARPGLSPARQRRPRHGGIDRTLQGWKRLLK